MCSSLYIRYLTLVITKNKNPVDSKKGHRDGGWCKKRRDKPGMGLEAHFMT